MGVDSAEILFTIFKLIWNWRWHWHSICAVAFDGMHFIWILFIFLLLLNEIPRFLMVIHHQWWWKKSIILFSKSELKRKDDRGKDFFLNNWCKNNAVISLILNLFIICYTFWKYFIRNSNIKLSIYFDWKALCESIP